MQEVAGIGAKAVQKVHGTRFVVGPICRTIYQASGASVDWAYETAKVPFPFAIELRDTGKYGFLLPPKFIVPSGEEMLAGVIAMSRELIKDFK
jgi:carboxypeptidase A1